MPAAGSATARVERILVFFSGADDPDVTSRAVDGLGAIAAPVDVVVGAAYPHLDGAGAIVARQPGTRLHVNTDAMAELMDAADLAVGAASSASWERCALGLPAVLVTLADNQVDAQRLLVEAGAARSRRLARRGHAGRHRTSASGPSAPTPGASRRCRSAAAT